MKLHDISNAVSNARATVCQGDQVVRSVACLLMGRLRIARVDAGVLRKLKRELRDFNMTTGKWEGETRCPPK